MKHSSLVYEFIINHFRTFKYVRECFYILFSIHFILLISSCFCDFKWGATIVLLSCLILIFLTVHIIIHKYDKSQYLNCMFWLYIVWGVYCILEIANPNNVMYAWAISFAHYFVFPIICALVVPIAIKHTKDIHILLIIWSVFVLIMVFKGIWQQYVGFNDKELLFLYAKGGARTHVIWSGVRYFSFFTDAANFGVHMALSAATFGATIFYTRSSNLKVYYFFVFLAALYGMAISCTRTAIPVFFVALLISILLLKKWKIIVSGLAVMAVLFTFFYFTTIGNGNLYINKIRSSFSPTKDASYLVRLSNRKQISFLMKNRPFGYGQGLSKSDRFNPKEVMPFPPDSWLVSVWVENGIVGFVLYLLLLLILFVRCFWIVLFKIKHDRLRGLLVAWLSMDVGFFVATMGNDVMQYPNSIVVYTGLALCFAGPYIDRNFKKRVILRKELL